MPRYFQSLISIGRPVSVGGRSFVFEPIEPMGGSWLGVLVVDDESTASHLASNGGDEITAERYEALKKKATERTTQGFSPSQPPRLPAQPLSPGNAGHAVARTSSPGDAGPSEATKTVSSITLRTTTQKPPAEPLLESLNDRKRKAA